MMRTSVAFLTKEASIGQNFVGDSNTNSIISESSFPFVFIAHLRFSQELQYF